MDLTELANAQSVLHEVVLESVQDMLLKVALQLARDDYENRRKRQKRGIELAKRQGRYRGELQIYGFINASLSIVQEDQVLRKQRNFVNVASSLVKSVWAKFKKEGINHNAK